VSLTPLREDKIAENAREDILKAAEFPWLILGDGCEALWMGATELIDSETGTVIIEAIIKPNSYFQKAYNIPTSQLNKHGQITVKFAKEDLIHLNEFNPYLHKIIYTKTFNHEKTPLSAREENLQLRLKEYEKRIWTMEGNIIKLGEDLKTAKNNPLEFASSQLEFIEKLASITGGRRNNQEE
jgi:hypothetical protein